MAENIHHSWAEAFAKSSYDLPSEAERKTMSPLQLAQLLSKYEKTSPPYLLLEHELNMLLAKEQAKATFSSGWLGLIGSISSTLLGAVLGYLLGASPWKEMNQKPPQQICRCECGTPIERPVSVPKPGAPSSIVPSSKNMEIQSHAR